MRVRRFADFESFRRWARQALARNLAPAEIALGAEYGGNGFQQSLFRSCGEGGRPPAHPLVIKPREIRIFETVSMHSCETQWQLMYRLLWRMRNGEPEILMNPADSDRLTLERLYGQVRRDIHKMHAFVRFKKLEQRREHPAFLAWHQPDHYVLKAALPFFVKRFGDKPFAIFTPYLGAVWDTLTVRFVDGMPAQPDWKDSAEDLWRAYYSAIFNPARIKLKMMKREMPVRYWRSMPETSLIEKLVADAPRRLSEMATQHKAIAHPPVVTTLEQLRGAASSCKVCPWAHTACQTVFGDGAPDASIVLVGEQPGDIEDKQGVPFCGPAGGVLREIIKSIGLKPDQVYVTNAVKHFKFERRGKRRLHQRPSGEDILACKPWLMAELQLLRPQVALCLGKTAAQAVLGASVAIKDASDLYDGPLGVKVLVTFHPSAVLRAQDVQRATSIRAAIRLALTRAKDIAMRVPTVQPKALIET